MLRAAAPEPQHRGQWRGEQNPRGGLRNGRGSNHVKRRTGVSRRRIHGPGGTAIRGEVEPCGSHGIPVPSASGCGTARKYCDPVSREARKRRVQDGSEATDRRGTSNAGQAKALKYSAGCARRVGRNLDGKTGRAREYVDGEIEAVKRRRHRWCEGSSDRIGGGRAAAPDEPPTRGVISLTGTEIREERSSSCSASADHYTQRYTQR